MATKKKPTKKRELTPAEKRSKAARKGWATRRRNERLVAAKKKASDNQKRLRNAARVEKKKPRVEPISLAGKTKKEVEALNRELKKKVKDLEAKLAEKSQTDDWVDAVDIEYLRRNGTIALEPSRARHDPDYWTMRARLQCAKDEEYFDEECYALADEYDYDVREIYTMWLSG